MLFDLDGVLVDSVRVVERAWRRWAEEQHLRADEVLAAIHGRRAQCVVVEDAPAGVLAGKRAGMTVLAVATTHPAAALSHADRVLGGMDEVTRCLREVVRPG